MMNFEEAKTHIETFRPLDQFDEIDRLYEEKMINRDLYVRLCFIFSDHDPYMGYDDCMMGDYAT